MIVSDSMRGILNTVCNSLTCNALLMPEAATLHPVNTYEVPFDHVVGHYSREDRNSSAQEQLLAHRLSKPADAARLISALEQGTHNGLSFHPNWTNEVLHRQFWTNYAKTHDIATESLQAETTLEPTEILTLLMNVKEAGSCFIGNRVITMAAVRGTSLSTQELIAAGDKKLSIHQELNTFLLKLSGLSAGLFVSG